MMTTITAGVLKDTRMLRQLVLVTPHALLADTQTSHPEPLAGTAPKVKVAVGDAVVYGPGLPSTKVPASTDQV